ncbi:hypothetical protein ACFE04_026019 [Oxalis oulophora]
MSVNPSSSNATGKQKTKRRKAIAKIEDSSALQVTFCKRRRGLFHKAAELSVLTGAEIAVVTFSPAGKPFHFASNSDINSIINKYTSGNLSTPLAINIDGENQNPSRYGNKSIKDVQREYEASWLKLHKVKEQTTTDDEGWWDSVDIEELRSMEEIEAYAKAIEEKLRDLKEKNKIVTMVVDGDDSSAGHVVDGGDSSRGHVFNDGGDSSGANYVDGRGTTFYEWL